jgi:hypothetical protein
MKTNLVVAFMSSLAACIVSSIAMGADSSPSTSSAQTEKTAVFTVSDAQQQRHEDVPPVVEETKKQSRQIDNINGKDAGRSVHQMDDYQNITALYQYAALLIGIITVLIGASALISWRNFSDNIKTIKNTHERELNSFREKIKDDADKYTDKLRNELKETVQNNIDDKFTVNGNKKLSEYTAMYSDINIRIYEIWFLTYSRILHRAKEKPTAADPHLDYIGLIEKLMLPAANLPKLMFGLLSPKAEDRGEALNIINMEWIGTKDFPREIFCNLLRALRKAGYINTPSLTGVAEQICRSAKVELWDDRL